MLDLKSLIRSIPDYPKPGILFRDVTTLIEHPEGFRVLTFLILFAVLMWFVKQRLWRNVEH